MTCPNCGRTKPLTAPICRCGYSYITLKVNPPMQRPDPRKAVRERGQERLSRGKLVLVIGIAGGVGAFAFGLPTRALGLSLALVISGIYEWVRGVQQVKSGVAQPE